MRSGAKLSQFLRMYLVLTLAPLGPLGNMGASDWKPFHATVFYPVRIFPRSEQSRL